MNLTPGTRLFGFTVQRVRQVDELHAVMVEMTHDQTGAQLIWMDNGENNKLFSIAFKTLPWDDTGVFHILEHSVLCGSRRFPVKEPFVELMKGSMNTFLNAMTFSDKTVFPVSSRNEADFLNLVRVYLDGVFFPAIYENPCIFWQEGWHYDLQEDGGVPCYRGVVLNEMKGGFSSVDTLLERGLRRMLFPDNCYSYVSGGDPAHIPELTYEQFLAAHREFYHPSNARIYLDGDVPLERVLSMLDKDYLSRFSFRAARHDVVLQKPCPSARAVEYYEIGREESGAQKAQMALGKILCDWTDRKKLMAFWVLSAYLTGSNEAPLTRSVLQSGLAQNVELTLDGSIAQPFFTLLIQNTEQEHREKIKAILRETARSLAAQGLDREALEAAINQLEFQTREPAEPKGLTRCFNALISWLHGGDPLLYLTCDELFAQLRAETGTGYYERLLEEVLLETDHTAELYLLPSASKGDEDRAAEQDRLRLAQSRWSAQRRQEVLENNRRLALWQRQPDAPEALNTLPALSLAQVRPEPERMETRRSDVDGVTVLFHPAAEQGVVHFNLYFSLADQSPEDLSALSFLTELLGELPTRRHTVAELQREVQREIGLLDYNVTACAVPGNPEVCRPYFAVSCSVLEERLPSAVNLIAEILTETVFTGEQSEDIIRDIVLQCDESLYQSIVMEGGRFAQGRVLSHFSAAAAAQERMTGFAMFQWLDCFAQEFDRQIDAFRCLVQTASLALFRSDRMTLSETAAQPHEALLALIPRLHKAGGQDIPKDMVLPVSAQPVREAVQVPANVSCAAFGVDLSRFGRGYDGGLQVLSSILSYSYLWNEVRILGGAYGCGFQAGETGEAVFYSYRDPNPARSLEVFRKAAEYVRGFCAGDEPLDKYIISSIAAMEPLRSPGEQGCSADMDAFQGISYEDRLRVRRQMLALKKEDLLSYCGLLEAMADGSAACVIGPGNALPMDSGERWTVYRL